MTAVAFYFLLILVSVFAVAVIWCGALGVLIGGII